VKALKLQQPQFGIKLRELRTGRGLSQRDLAGEVVTASYISLVESGARMPALDVLIHLSSMLGVPLSELTGMDLQGAELPGTALSGGAPERPSGTRADDGGRELPPQAVSEMILARTSLSIGALGAAREELEQLYRSPAALPSTWERLSVGFALSEVLAALSANAERYALAGELAALADRADQDSARFKALVDLAGAARDNGKLAEAYQVIEKATALLPTSRFAGTSEHARMLGVRLSVVCELDRDAEIGPPVRELLDVAQQAGIPAVVGSAHWAAATAYSRGDQAEKAVEHLMEARRILTSLDLPVRQWLRFCTASASVLIDLGVELETARTYLDVAYSIVQVSPGASRPLVDSIHARYLLAVGDAEASEKLCRSVMKDSSALIALDQARLLAAWGKALGQLGRNGEAAAHLRESALLYEKTGALRAALKSWRAISELERSPSGGY
jgi:transcriptional regulator with XRE-family HTH domain